MLCSVFLMFVFAGVSAQETEQKEPRQEGHTNQNKFRQMYQEMATPNSWYCITMAAPQRVQEGLEFCVRDLLLRIVFLL